MTVYRLDPVQDVRWEPFLEWHPDASVFHSRPWLQTLQQSYGYQPVAYTTSSPDQPLQNALVFCRVRSWLTGSRLVSLPFSDHAQPLVNNAVALAEILGHLQTLRARESWRYIEIRPRTLQGGPTNLGLDATASESFVWQRVDLHPEPDRIFAGFHKSCVQRKIRRAERDGVTCVEGRSSELLNDFYQLSILTRRRHGLPPQPLSWFRNLLHCLGNLALIRVAFYRCEPIAAILTLCFKNSLTYKYGCSDERFHNLGAMPLLFWKAIEAGKQGGVTEFDLGRSEIDNPGLIHFKENFGAESSLLQYYRLPARAMQPRASWGARIARDVFARMPGSLLTATSRLLYRHLG
jgi:Acetyltransferase (GNAT) domain